MLEYKFDTQLLIEGENLSEDDIHDYSSKSTIIPTSPGTFSLTERLWVTSSMSSWKTWNGRKTA